MDYRIRQIEAEGQFCEAVAMDALTQHIPLEIIEQVVAECQVTETVPDTPANEAYFGRLKGDRGHSAFPLVRCVYLY
jgi:hypothetical protein